MRGKCAVALWIWSLCILMWSAKHLELVFGWREWLTLTLQLGKSALLIYCGLSLIEADQEIGKLQGSNRQLEEIIGELQAKP